MRWFFQASVNDCLNTRLCHFFLCILPILSIFPYPRHSHHTNSSAHLGFPCLRPRISDCCTRSFAHLGVARLHPSIPITHPYFLFLLAAVILHAYLPTDPPPPFSFPRFLQGVPKLFFCRLLAPPHPPPPPPSFMLYLPCIYLTTYSN